MAQKHGTVDAKVFLAELVQLAGVKAELVPSISPAGWPGLCRQRHKPARAPGCTRLCFPHRRLFNEACRRGTGDDVLSIWAPSVEPEGTSVSSWGSSIDPGAGACRAREQAKTPVGLIRPGGSPPRPRRTWAAGRTAALATEWPFQRRGAAGR